MLSLSTKGMCFFPLFLNEICVWSTEMEISRIVFDSRRVVPLRAESTVVELGYGQPLGAELSVKYIFIKKFFRDASDHRSYTLLSYFARAAFNRPALHAVILHGKVSASRFRISYFSTIRELFDRPTALSLLVVRNIWPRKLKNLSSRRSWWFVGRGNKVTEKKFWAALRARKKRKQEQTTFRGNQYRWGFECRGDEFSATKVLLGEKVNGLEERVPPQFPCLSIIDHPNDIIQGKFHLFARKKKKKRKKDIYLCKWEN